MNQQTKRKRIITRYVTTQTTTLRPFHRMVLLEVCPEGVEIFPVIGIESRIRHCYELRTRFDDSDPIQIHDHEDFLAAGFHYRGEDVEHGVLFLYPEYNEVICSIDDDWKCDNCEYVIMCCCWPKEEDRKQLAKTITKAGYQGDLKDVFPSEVEAGII